MGAQADQVRDDILARVQGRLLMPGDRIDEVDLRERLRLSVTPIREALIALETLGVVERRPRDGARIAALDAEGLMKMIEVLAEAEGALAFRAARRINPAQAERLQQAARACRDWLKAGTGDGYYDLNLDFHRSIMAAAGNEYLSQMALGAANRLIGYLAARHRLLGEAEASVRDHEEITSAILDAAGDRARALMIAHVSFSDTMALDVINALRR
ncbi:GntR family transcriptional regulator [Paracoccus marinaquae]|uniref:GntR family transcriptional regulator n=1 Tax=Paracoccus marinaquae TaxID=2841926 RepID=A0ABS6AMP8_9RHOB|nr:GntR family transcriptional regulator [Paracoccus marinaquae]MBU3031873.1 GntR family transcriptional regulator [Paracoccus marinaquae]